MSGRGRFISAYVSSESSQDVQSTLRRVYPNADIKADKNHMRLFNYQSQPQRNPQFSYSTPLAFSDGSTAYSLYLDSIGLEGAVDDFEIIATYEGVNVPVYKELLGQKPDVKESSFENPAAIVRRLYNKDKNRAGILLFGEHSVEISAEDSQLLSAFRDGVPDVATPLPGNELDQIDSTRDQLRAVVDETIKATFRP